MTKALGVLLGALLPVALSMGQIQYTIDGGTPQALPTSQIINVGSLTTGTTTLHIFDSSGVDESIVGQVLIQGTATSGASLQVKVVHQSDTDAFTGEATRVLAFGLRDFGGLTFESTSLRDRSVVAVSIQGDITGDIDAAQIWRIDALADENGTFGGHIRASITAWKPDESVIAEAASISYVRASFGIGPHADTNRQAEIKAIGERTEVGAIALGGSASIDRVIVGPVSNTQGIQADILAEDGRIGTIYTTGPIGQTGASPVARLIWAGNGIREIRAVLEENTETVLVKDFNVSIKSNRAIERVRGESIGNPPEPAINSYAWTTPPEDGALWLLETGGNLNNTFDQSLNATNIGCYAACGVSLPLPGDCDKSGIYVKGTCDLYIFVDYHVLWANLVAGEFVKPINIGRFLKGSVVAMGFETAPAVGPNGLISSVHIGGGDLVPNMPLDYTKFGVGLCGLDVAPFSPLSRFDWFTAPSGTECTALDSVIRSNDLIAECDLRVLGLDFQPIVSSMRCKTTAPRVEAPTITSLKIDDFRAGSVWSGNLDPNATYDDYYAKIGSVDIGCMSQYADIWMKDWSLPPPNTQLGIAEFHEHVLGDIHVPSIPSNAVIRIGRELGDVLEDTSPAPTGR